MRRLKSKYGFYLAVLFLFGLVGCERKLSNEQTVESEVSYSTAEEPMYTQSRIDEDKIVPKEIKREEWGKDKPDYSKLPLSDKKQPIDDVQLLIVYESAAIYGPELNDDFVVDLHSKMMYLDPYAIDSYEPDWKLEKKDIKILKKLIQEFDIQNWEDMYGTPPKPLTEGEKMTSSACNDPYYWNVLLVYKDETISKSEGYIQMEQYDRFHQALMDFRDEQREKWRDSIDVENK